MRKAAEERFAISSYDITGLLDDDGWTLAAPDLPELRMHLIVGYPDEDWKAVFSARQVEIRTNQAIDGSFPTCLSWKPIAAIDACGPNAVEIGDGSAAARMELGKQLLELAAAKIDQDPQRLSRGDTAMFTRLVTILADHCETWTKVRSDSACSVAKAEQHIDAARLHKDLKRIAAEIVHWHRPTGERICEVGTVSAGFGEVPFVERRGIMADFWGSMRHASELPPAFSSHEIMGIVGQFAEFYEMAAADLKLTQEQVDKRLARIAKKLREGVGTR